MTTTELPDTTIALLREYAMKADAARRELEYVNARAAWDMRLLENGQRVEFSTNVSRAADEYAKAIHELNQAERSVALFIERDDPRMKAAALGMEALHEALKN